MHPFRTNRLTNKPAFRVADIGSTVTAIASAVTDLANPSQLPLASDPRNGDLTAKVLAAPRFLAELAWKKGPVKLLPDGVHPIEDGGNVDIRLADGQQCNPQEWLRGSPFADNLHSALTAFLAKPGALDALKANAAAFQLVILDWNDNAKRHGQKVTSVVKGLLSELGVPDLPFHEVDLNPTNGPDELRTIFGEYQKNYYCALKGVDCKSKGQEGLIKDVDKWLNSKPQAVKGIASLKQLLLEAVLWKYFAASKAVVNMSFSVDSLALEILQAQFLAASHSVGVVAASDDASPQGTAGIPQRAASIYPNFFNVTYGNSDGTILGGFSNSGFNIIVTTVAQGCGFNYGDITASDSGTSFAAPYVATAVWLKALMGSLDPSTVRRNLVQSSHVLVALDMPSIESAGAFDLAAFLLPNLSYVESQKGVAEQTASAKLTLSSVKDSGGTVTETFQAGELVSIGFVRQPDGGLWARIRTLKDQAASPLPVADTLVRRVTAATLDIVLAKNGQPRHYETNDFGNTVAEVKF